ncbi:hypothetical protein AB0G04_38560 [Actinoplanes sp. NPDC023801]
MSTDADDDVTNLVIMSPDEFEAALGGTLPETPAGDADGPPDCGCAD